MTHTDSGLVRELECVERRALRQAASKGTFLKGGSQLLCLASKEGGVGVRFSPTQDGSCIDQRKAAGAQRGSGQANKEGGGRCGGGEVLICSHSGHLTD